MAETASATLIAELDDVIKVGSASRQTRILKQVTDLFQADVDRLDERQTNVFDDVLLRLMERVDTQELAHLSTILSEIELAPQQTVCRLAFHEDAAVASPVLAKSNRLSEKVLVEIAASVGQAIAAVRAEGPSLRAQARQVAEERFSPGRAVRDLLAVAETLACVSPLAPANR